MLALAAAAMIHSTARASRQRSRANRGVFVVGSTVKNKERRRAQIDREGSLGTLVQPNALSRNRSTTAPVNNFETRGRHGTSVQQLLCGRYTGVRRTNQRPSDPYSCSVTVPLQRDENLNRPRGRYLLNVSISPPSLCSSSVASSRQRFEFYRRISEPTSRSQRCCRSPEV